MPSDQIVNLSLDPDSATVASAIKEGLRAYNRATRPDPDAAPVILAVTADDGHTIAGLVGHTGWGWLEIEILWVDELLRGQGFGRRLMDDAERIARERGCTGMHLDTPGLQTPGFYKMLGFETFGVLENYPDVFFRKFL